MRQIIRHNPQPIRSFLEGYRSRVKICMENSIGGSVIKHYTAGMQRVAVRTGDGVRYVFANHLGSAASDLEALSKLVRS